MRLLGHVRDVPDPRDRHIGALLGELGTYPMKLSHRGSCAPVRDQRGNSCVGETLARQVHTVARIAGTPVAYPAPIACYTLGRQYGSFGVPLMDVGSQPRKVMQAAREFGIVALDRWDDTVDVDTPVALDVLDAGADSLVTGYYRVDDNIVPRLCQALAAGFIPGFGMPIDSQYEQLGSEVYQGLSGPELGGHDQAIVGFDLTAPVPYFEIIGSWGELFGSSGFARISVDFIASDACFDRYVVQAAPRVVR